MRLKITVAVITASFSIVATAQTQRDLGSHEHGAASLNVALEADSVFLEMESPWNNLVGFEHAPRTEEQHVLIDAALAKLAQPEQLFVFNGAECEVTDTDIVNGIATEDADGDDHDHDEEHDDEHHDEAHDDKHDDEHHDEAHDDKHDDEHDHDHDEAHGDEHDEETHSEIRVSYSFKCSNLEQLSAIDVKVLEQWSGFEELDVQMIGPGGQTSAELVPGESSLDVSAVQ